MAHIQLPIPQHKYFCEIHFNVLLQFASKLLHWNIPKEQQGYSSTSHLQARNKLSNTTAMKRLYNSIFHKF
jgi:hypothetical protein